MAVRALGYQSSRDLLLHEEDCAWRGSTRRPFENRRGDVIGQIAGDGCPSPLRQIGREHVSVDQLETRFAGEFMTELVNQERVKLNGDHAVGTLQQFFGERAAAGAY